MKNLLIVSMLFLTQLSADVNKEGLFGGIGIGLSSSKLEDDTSRNSGFAIPFRFGYGINKDLLIYISGEGASRTKNENINVLSHTTIVEVLAGLGISYYIDDLNYIKATFGNSSMKVENIGINIKYDGKGHSFGYGHMLSKKSSVEITYTELTFNKVTYLGRVGAVDGSSNIISITYQYYWF